ncbi:MAG: hydrogenase expression/formation protein HypE [Desulfobacterales bacterium]|jgi:hydrogenase expression/formation protein HypE|nr:hydrogenase expression/formation protein HypE [Desulfobacteraceae bacterium]MDD3990677.1 hydrogenase expression/formation protein HypE [Desulfobacteraceae bacterium]MDY0311051.1 hydrogenase expression/formation protein HypE [Desulfobacterales bacterium]
MTPETILLDHGAGGKLAHRLTTEVMLPILGNPILDGLHDGAIFDLPAGRVAFSTDTYTVTPLFFPGGSIGDLAVNGTVNDVAMCGARPIFLSLALVIEEGLTMAELERILKDVAVAARRAGVAVVTGDTKVVPRGAADKIFINTAGIGVVAEGVNIGGHRARPGDKVLLSGSIADHGMTIMTQRAELGLAMEMQSDSAPLNGMVQRMLAAAPGIHVLRDPTRGGLGTALCEIALQSRVAIRIDEAAVPVRPAVAGACELLGFDPLYVANEGKLIALVAPEDEAAVLAAMRADAYGEAACTIGEVTVGSPGQVTLTTGIGGERIVDMLAGEQLPRIC